MSHERAENKSENMLIIYRAKKRRPEQGILKRKELKELSHNVRKPNQV